MRVKGENKSRVWPFYTLPVPLLNPMSHVILSDVLKILIFVKFKIHTYCLCYVKICLILW